MANSKSPATSNAAPEIELTAQLFSSAKPLPPLVSAISAEGYEARLDQAALETCFGASSPRVLGIVVFKLL